MSGQGATRILVIRHGQTDWNVQGRLQGHTDTPLNAEGRAQADRLRRALAGEALDAVYSSDLIRAHDTARGVAEATGAVLSVHRGLRERAFGRFEGVSFADLDRHWPDDAARWRRREPGFAPPDGGEALDAFYRRSVTTASELASRHPGGAIALVSHGGVLDSLYRAATRVALDAPRTWVVANASLNRLLYTELGFTLVGWNDDAHLLGPAPTGGA